MNGIALGKRRAARLPLTDEWEAALMPCISAGFEAGLDASAGRDQRLHGLHVRLRLRWITGSGHTEEVIR